MREGNDVDYPGVISTSCRQSSCGRIAWPAGSKMWIKVKEGAASNTGIHLNYRRFRKTSTFLTVDSGISGHTFFIITLCMLVGIVMALLWHDTAFDRHKDYPPMASFQKSIGGVGLGAVLVPAWNFSDFDPRLQPEATDSLYPLPGGYAYSPDRLAMVSNFGQVENPKRP